MTSLLEEGSIGVDMPPLPDNIWNGVGLLLLTDHPTFSDTFSETTVMWSIPENEPTTTAAEPRNGTIRWYDPVTGRWLSKDPIGISGGLNQYVFCYNNPVNFRDPTGLQPDLNLIAKGDPLYDTSQKINGPAGMFTVVVHGSAKIPGYVVIKDVTSEGKPTRELMSIGVLARRIIMAGWQRHQAIYFVSCQGGSSERGYASNAQQLADTLARLSKYDALVWGATTKVGANKKTGKVTVQNHGRWKPFKGQGKLGPAPRPRE